MKSLHSIFTNTIPRPLSTMKNLITLLALAILAACGQSAEKQNEVVTGPEVINDTYKHYYDSANSTGSFILYDLKNNRYTYYNKAEATTAYTPASTFKIPNSLIGLETGVIADENYIIKWDGKKRWNPDWDADHDLKTAYKNSTVWYYQELARRVGAQRMKEWVDKIGYGNKNTTGAVDMFWLNDTLKISPKQQIDFLVRLYKDSLPFSKRSMDIVKKIMIAKDTTGFKLRAKTGWGFHDKKDIGWYVGYVETNDNVYFFANCMQTADSTNKAFTGARIDICYKIFKDLGIYKY